MKTRAVAALVACLALSLHASIASGQYAPRSGGVESRAQAAAGESAGLGLAFVTSLSGEPLLWSADDEDWVALSPMLSLREGDRVWAQDGAKVEVRFPLGATAWVNYESELDLVRLESGSRADSLQLALVAGEASFDVKGFARTGSVFQVDLSQASIRAFRAARFRVNTLPDGTAQIGVISGSVALETPDGLTEVPSGRMAELQLDGRLMMDFLPDDDEWDHWVRSRAAIYDRPAASARYLPSDLSAYAHEFDTSGRWVRDQSYGNVWVPAVDRSWSPYSNGRWVWQVNDYVWLPFDPWYAPFHYGRWSWSISMGWFWIVPQGRAYWSPGYVSWSISDDEVSWVPLGHNEVYYGYGNYGPRTVNVYNTTTIKVTNVYVNSTVTNGVVAVKRDNFLRGRVAQERIASPRNPFREGGVGGVRVIARPPVREIKPIRETRQALPSAEIKRTSLPPERLKEVSQTIRGRAPAATKEKSVFRPGTKPAPLKNIQKDQELERWVPAKKAPAKPVAAPPPAERVRKDAAPVRPAPVRPAAVKPAPAPAPGGAVRPPAGKRQFKRVPEPAGGASVAPAPVIVPRERAKDDEEKPEKPEKPDRPDKRGGGKNR